MDIKKLRKSIKRIHRFAYRPKYQEAIYTKLNKTASIALILEAIQEIGWEIVYYDEETVEAKRFNKSNYWTEKIYIQTEEGKIIIKSTSLQNNWWDRGRNSLCVKLLILVFQEFEKQHDSEALKKFEQKFQNSITWDDYEIPESLPQPQKRRNPSLPIVLLGAIITAITTGYIIALTESTIQLFVLIEFGSIFSTCFIFKQLIRLSNYTNFKILYRIQTITIITSLISGQFFLNRMILPEYSFWEYLQRFAYYINDNLLAKQPIILGIGWLLVMGLVILIFTLAIPSTILSRRLSEFQIRKVPKEVIDFVYYLCLKDKDEEEIKKELAHFGWSEKQYQDDVFEAIGRIVEWQEFNRQ